jgi:hypothetical protein
MAIVSTPLLFAVRPGRIFSKTGSWRQNLKPVIYEIVQLMFCDDADDAIYKDALFENEQCGYGSYLKLRSKLPVLVGVKLRYT